LVIAGIFALIRAIRLLCGRQMSDRIRGFGWRGFGRIFLKKTAREKPCRQEMLHPNHAPDPPGGRGAVCDGTRSVTGKPRDHTRG